MTSSAEWEMPAELERTVRDFGPVSLDELNERAALQRRVDTKYIVSEETLRRVAAELSSAYRVLEIEQRRSFGYDSAYFDTPRLLCFRQHVAGQVPRFKARSRHYTETGTCFFEIKLKVGDDETLKRQIDCSPDEHGTLTRAARDFFDQVLSENDLEPVADQLQPSLTTRFRRATFAAARSAERVTCDSGVEMRAADGRSSRLRDDYVLVETKSEGGEGAWDRMLADADVNPVSVSKYRLGIAMLAASDPHNPLGEDVDRYFERG